MSKEWAYRHYIAKCLQTISQNTARPEDMFVATDLEHVLDPKPKEERTAEEIVKDLAKQGGLVVTHNGSI